MIPLIGLILQAAAPEAASYVAKAIRSVFDDQVILEIDSFQENPTLTSLQSFNAFGGAVLPYTLTRSKEGLSLICRKEDLDLVKAKLTQQSVQFKQKETT